MKKASASSRGLRRNPKPLAKSYQLMDQTQARSVTGTGTAGRWGQGEGARARGGPESVNSAASAAIADALAMHDFDKRERAVLDLLRLVAYRRENGLAEIRRLEWVARGAGISRGNASVILRRLQGMLIIQEGPEGFYGFRLPIANWKVAQRLELIEVMEQMDLGIEPPDLSQALREQFAEQARACQAREPGSSCERTARPEDGSANALSSTVPESGTVRISCDRTRIGYGRKEPMMAGLPATVPESGTFPHEHEHDRNIMSHEQRGFLERRFDVGTLERKSARDILAAVKRAAPGLRPRHERDWLRRIEEDARRVWELAMEAQARTGILNAAGWMNRSYMREMRLGRYADGTAVG